MLNASPGLRCVALTLTAFALAAPARAQQNVKCFKLTVDPWVGIWQGYRAREMPAFVGFDTVTVKTRSDVERMTLKTTLKFTGPCFSASWRALQMDSVVFGWGQGFQGVTVQGQIRGDTLTGAAEAWTDEIIEGRKNPTASLKGVRSPCPAEWKADQ